MKKLSFKTVQKTAGVGSLIPKEVKFHDAEGAQHEGEVLIKFLSHDEVVGIYTSLGKDIEEVKLSDYRKAVVLHAVYEDDDKPFFATFDEAGQVSSDFIDALYAVVDEVLDLSGKRKKSTAEKSSGVSLSSTALVEAQ